MASDPPTEPPELHEDVELDMERRRYILDAHAQLERITHYALLGVARSADRKAVKDAYFRLAGLVHPDRYFGKRLGSYKPKMEAVFARISIAYETLSRAQTRAEYDATLGVQEAEDKASGRHAAAAPVDPRVAEKRRVALEGLKQHFAEGKAKARHYAEVAARARAAGDVVAAAEAYRSALTFAPGDPEITAAYEAVQREAGAKLAESHKRKALLEERFGRWAAAVKSWERVVEAKPDDAEARARLANAVARANAGT
ncbi:MAG: Tetratricopeptide repeat protein [Labilithrix sp.]|nr:Tetratricopeptide repeat protein [Labilithrix sp.]